MKMLNANQKVYVQLKLEGIKVLKEKKINYTPNEKGLYEFTLWYFMSIFGEYLKYDGFNTNKYFSMDLWFNDEDFSTEEDYEKYQKLIKSK